MDNKVQRWLKYIEQNNKETAQKYYWKLRLFEKEMNIDSNKLLTMSEARRTKILEEYIMSLSSRKLAPKTQSFYISVIKSLLSFYRKQIKLSVKIHGINTTPTLRNERIPEPEQIKELLSRLSPRIKTSAALISFAGLRFQTQVSLQLEDLLDLDIQTLTFKRTPALIHIPAEKHKAGKRQGNSYFSLLIKEGCEIVEAYLKNRKAKGEILTEKSYVISTIQGTKILADPIRKELLKMTHNVLGTRAYVLRSYFNTSLLAAGIHPDWKRFFTGHTGDIEDIYSTRKLLPEWAIEKMREQFQPAAKQLTIMKPDAQEQEKAAAIAALKVIQGYSENLGINPESLNEIKHQLEAPIPA